MFHQILRDISVSSQITISQDNLTFIGVQKADSSFPIIQRINANINADSLFIIKNNVTFQNLELKNGFGKGSSGKGKGNCIKIITGGISVKIHNCVISTDSNGKGNPNPIDINGDITSGLTVSISDTVIKAFKGYGISVRAPVTLNIASSNISGYAALYFWNGASNSIINVENSIIQGLDKWSSTFGTISFNDSPITLCLENTDISAEASSAPYPIFYFGQGSSESQQKISITGGNLSVNGDNASIVMSKHSDRAVFTINNVKSDKKISFSRFVFLK